MTDPRNPIADMTFTLKSPTVEQAIGLQREYQHLIDTDQPPPLYGQYRILSVTREGREIIVHQKLREDT